MDEKQIINLLTTYRTFGTREAAKQLIVSFCLEKGKPENETRIFAELVSTPFMMHAVDLDEILTTVCQYYERKFNLNSIWINKEGRQLFIKYIKNETTE